MLALFDANFTLCDYLEHRNSTNSEFYDSELLRRAKLGLHSLAFFGLAEEQEMSRKLLTMTFNNQLFIQDLGFTNYSNSSATILKRLNEPTIRRIANLNKLDVELYDYAVKLFHDRFDYFENKY
jgi:hypothetical protein